MASDSNGMYVPKNILLTGGAGFIGSNVMIDLMNKYPSYTMVCYDVLDTCASVNNFAELNDNPRFTFVQGDLRSKDLLTFVIKKYNIDTILHFAAQTHVDNSFGNSTTFTQSNVLGTHILLEVVRVLGSQIKRFVHVSTDEVYGEVAGDVETRCIENSLLNPTNPYSATKASAEFLVKSYGTSFQLPYIITRGNNVFGPKQFPEKLIPKFINLLARGRPCPLHGDGTQRRSYLYVSDVSAAFDLILHKGAIGAIYNIGADEEFENRTVLTKLVAIFKKMGKITPEQEQHACTFVRNRAFNDFRYHIDCTSLVNLGWVKKYTNFDEALQLTVDWYLSHMSHWGENIDGALVAHPYAMHHNGNADESATAVRNGNLVPVSSPRSSGLRWLIYGGRGWIGGQVIDFIQTTRPDDIIVVGNARCDNDTDLTNEINAAKPDRVLCFIGRTHGPGYTTIDYLEQKGKVKENVGDNLFSPLLIAMICQSRGIHCTYLGTGCIFKYDDVHRDEATNPSRVGFNEQDLPNFFGSSYSVVKGYTDRLFHVAERTGLLTNTLNVRIRMPITADWNPRNFITKITTYKKICSQENSMSVLPDILPILVNMSIARETGTVNMTNPGTISHNRILELYKQIVDPDFTWENFSKEEQALILLSDRSNNYLSTTRVESFCPSIPHIEASIIELLKKMTKNPTPNK